MDSSVNLNPSFSSTLLDSIYCSFDQCQDDLTTKKLGGCTPLNRTKSYNNGGFHGSDLAAGTRRACRNGAVPPRNSDAAASGFGGKQTALKTCYSHGSSSSDVFSSGGRPKPIRTRVSDEKFNNVNKLSSHDPRDRSQQKPKHEGKLRALDQNDGDLKRENNKTPVSPAGRLAIFLNSLFTARKTKSGSSSGVGRSERSENASACSRSCLSKHTPSSRINSAGKRTVTFFPVSVIIGEDCPPCGHKNLINDQKKVEKESEYLTNGHLEIFEIDEDDLFELDNLSAIGKERNGEELPVYETTHLGNKRALVNGLLL